MEEITDPRLSYSIGDTIQFTNKNTGKNEIGKIKDYMYSGYILTVLERIGNTNRLKITDKQIDLIIPPEISNHVANYFNGSDFIPISEIKLWDPSSSTFSHSHSHSHSRSRRNTGGKKRKSRKNNKNKRKTRN